MSKGSSFLFSLLSGLITVKSSTKKGRKEKEMKTAMRTNQVKNKKKTKQNRTYLHHKDIFRFYLFESVLRLRFIVLDVNGCVFIRRGAREARPQGNV